MENVVLDVAYLDAGVLRRRSVLEERLEPGGKGGNHRRTREELRGTVAVVMQRGGGPLPRRRREQQNFVCIKRLPLHQESNVRHVLVVEEVGV